jgi:hypothetical protein
MSQKITPLLRLLTFATYTALSSAEYTVHSSFLFFRTGDRTPSILGDSPTTLTPLGAQQLYSTGEFFRARYITNEFSGINITSGLQKATIDGLSINTPLDLQLYLLATDQQSEVASAQAFMQGLYPPFSIMTDGNGGNLGEGDGVVAALDSLGVLGNGSYVSNLCSLPTAVILPPCDYSLDLLSSKLPCLL